MGQTGVHKSQAETPTTNIHVAGESPFGSDPDLSVYDTQSALQGPVACWPIAKLQSLHLDLLEEKQLAAKSEVVWAGCGCFFLEVGNLDYSSALFPLSLRVTRRSMEQQEGDMLEESG